MQLLGVLKLAELASQQVRRTSGVARWDQQSRTSVAERVAAQTTARQAGGGLLQLLEWLDYSLEVSLHSLLELRKAK